MYFNFEEESLHFTEGYIAIAEAMCDPASVLVVRSESGKYYVQAESVENYMLSNGIIDPKDAIIDITNANKIDFSDINIVGISDLIDREKLCKCMDESCVYTNEAAAEDGAMTLKQAEKWYNKVIKKCKSEAESKEEINDCIDTLKICVRKMEKTKEEANQKRVSKDRIIYTLKGAIPFYDIFRLIRKHDMFAGIDLSLASGMKVSEKISNRAIERSVAKSIEKAAASGNQAEIIHAKLSGATKLNNRTNMNPVILGVKLGIRYSTYIYMLDNCIKQTNEAIEYLEKKKDELDDDSEDKK